MPAGSFDLSTASSLKVVVNEVDHLAVSERRVRLLYKTDCWQCDDPIDAGTTTWWDDDRRHATCLGCFPERDGLPDGEGMAPLVRTIDLRTLRRLEIVRAHHRSRTLRPTRRPERLEPVPRTGS